MRVMTRYLITDLAGVMPVRSFSFVVARLLARIGIVPEDRLFLELLLHSEYILPGPLVAPLAVPRREWELAVSRPRFQASHFNAAELGDLFCSKCQLL